MTTDSTGRPPPRILLLAAIPYGASLACIYLLAYWKPLGINPFHYANAADLTSATLGGMAVAIGVGAISALLGVMFNDYSERKADTPLPASKFGRLLVEKERYAIYAIVLYWIISSYLKSDPFFWFYVGLTLSIALFFHFGKKPFYGEIFNNRYAFYSAPFLLIAAPFSFFFYGSSEIRSALDPDTAIVVDPIRSDLELKEHHGALLYAGMLGKHHVIYEVSTGATILVPEGAPIVLYNMKKKAPKPAAKQ